MTTQAFEVQAVTDEELQAANGGFLPVLFKAAKVGVRVYDARGSLVKVLEQSQRRAGRYEVGWDATNTGGEPVASGVYFYRLATPGFLQTRKMVLLR